MNILILGDVVGLPGRNALEKNLTKIILEKKIDFTIVNGENAADDGRGITNKIANSFFNNGVDVITSGNHIWDKKETPDFISNEKRLLRPANLPEGSPGNGYGIYSDRNNSFKVTVINLMGNVFMKKNEDAFQIASRLQNKIQLKKNCDFLVVDFHGEITSEKNAIGHFYDGRATAVVGTHTHVPTADCRILNNGTAFQTDLGMCGDYDSVIGMDKINSVMKFLNDKKAVKHFPAIGEATLSGIIVNANKETGLANKVERLIYGGVLKK